MEGKGGQELSRHSSTEENRLQVYSIPTDGHEFTKCERIRSTGQRQPTQHSAQNRTKMISLEMPKYTHGNETVNPALQLIFPTVSYLESNLSVHGQTEQNMIDEWTDRLLTE